MKNLTKIAPLIAMAFVILLASCAPTDTTTATTETTLTPTAKITPTPKPTPSPTPDAEYIFADEFFGEMVKTALDKEGETIYYSDILSIRRIDMYGDFLWINNEEYTLDELDSIKFVYKGETYYGSSNIKTFEDISNFKNLNHLTISLCNIMDLTFLSNMTNLRNLCLYGNKITDLQPLSQLTQLIALDIRCNRLTSCQGIEALTNLQMFEYGGNISLHDITPILGLKKLKHLDLAGLEISDLSFITNFKDLEVLILPYNNITDITPLLSLTKLVRLDIGDNKITHIAPLSSLPNLRYLYAVNNPIKDLDEFVFCSLIEFEH